MGKKILLTGATGFLGSHLLRSFIEKGWAVSIIKRSFSKAERIRELLPMVDYLDCDTKPIESIFEKNAPFDAVVHTAVCYGRHNEPAAKVMETNLFFPLRLLETATFFNTTSFFNTATKLYAYLNHYALSKHQFEDWGRIFANQGRIQFVNIKLEHMYGPRDDSSKFTTFIVDSLKKNVPEIALTSGEQKRDFIYIDDVVDFFLMILEKGVQIGLGFQEFDLGSGKAVSIREFVETVKGLTRADTELSFGAKAYRENEIMHSEANISRLRKMKWKPRYSLTAGLKKMIEAERSICS